MATMDFFAEDTASANSIGPFHSSTSNSVNPGRKGSHGFLQKLFSRQPSIPKNVTAGLEGQVIPCPFGNTADSNHIDPEVVPCPYIRPLGNRLEPRVESTPLAPRRLLTDAAMSISRKKGEVSLAAHSCLSLGNADKEPRRKLSASDIMNLRSLRLREDIAVAATADPCHLKEWGCYIKCYSEVRSCTIPYVETANALAVICAIAFIRRASQSP